MGFSRVRINCTTDMGKGIGTPLFRCTKMWKIMLQTTSHLPLVIAMNERINGIRCHVLTTSGCKIFYRISDTITDSLWFFTIDIVIHKACAIFSLPSKAKYLDLATILLSFSNCLFYLSCVNTILWCQHHVKMTVFTSRYNFEEL